MVGTTYTAKWQNDENIAGLSSVYQTQSGLDGAVSGLNYQKDTDVTNAISALSSVYQRQDALDTSVSNLGYQKSTDVTNAISALNLSSTYQTQSGLDSAVSTLGYQKSTDVTNAISALNLSSTYQTQSGLSTAVTSVVTGLNLQTQAGLDGAVTALGYVKSAGADATKAGNVYSALASFFTMLSNAAEIKDADGNPYDFSSLISTLNA